MLKSLHEKIASDVEDWREQGYPCEKYPLIKTILAYQRCGGEGDETLLYLHAAQFRALETYWFLRLVKETPLFMDMYRGYYEGKELLDALSVEPPKGVLDFLEPDNFLKQLLGDEEKARKFGIDAVLESCRLKYPSYIFALTMGAGKTVLIGSIIATEFVMSLEYPKGNFMKNALVFAPGTTIIESLRELSSIDYENILPPYHCKKFMANVKMHYTSKKQGSINTQIDSRYNLVVTNTEKFILRKSNKSSLQKEKELEEHLRFYHLSQLPSLGIFSDEAHHTYGNKAGDELKRVRQTIDRLHERRNLVCVVNTTGTPYYKKQFLKDVVIWYGLKEGIRDKVLKSLSDGVRRYSIERSNYQAMAQKIVKDFFACYGDVALPSGQKAKIAFYFNRQEDLDKVKGAIEKAVVEQGESVVGVLTNTQESSSREVEEFHRLNDARSDKRVILLVGKGREGWNCPSLFACALITKQTSASNYVLQASARCLRRVEGVEKAARIYLDHENAEILDRELRDNFGEHMSLAMLTGEAVDKETLTVEIMKTDLPRLVVDTERHTWERSAETRKPLRFQPPHLEAVVPHVREEVMDVQLEDDFKALVQREMRRLPIEEKVSLERAASEIAFPLRLDGLEVLRALREIYEEETVAQAHVEVLRGQAEQTLGVWEKRTETLRRVIALIHTRNEQGEALFEERGSRLFHTFQFSKTRFEEMKAKGLFVAKKAKNGTRGEETLPSASDEGDVSFHYNPYNFDSRDERDAFVEFLQRLNLGAHEVEGLYFTGSLTDHRKTDMWFEYKGEDGFFHRYFPDFVLCKKNGEWLIVEVKAQRDKNTPAVERKAKAVMRLVALQPKKIGYHIVYYPPGDLQDIRTWIAEEKGGSKAETKKAPARKTSAEGDTL